jgi:hypothetical protein
MAQVGLVRRGSGIRVFDSRDGAIEWMEDQLLSRARFDALVATDPALGGIIFERLAVAISKRLRSADTKLRVLEER